jgi:hypothetical protein
MRNPERLAQPRPLSSTAEERGMPVNLLPAYGAGIQIHVEHLADYIGGREPRGVETRWSQLFPAYEALGVSQGAHGR